MQLTVFKNTKGLIHGSDPRRICCDRDGTLRIGTTEISITAGNEEIMPTLFHGCTGDYDATFTDKDGQVYRLEKVAVRGGRIAPPNNTAMELMELRCRADAAEEECERLRAEIKELSEIFDTNALNFLIK